MNRNKLVILSLLIVFALLLALCVYVASKELPYNQQNASTPSEDASTQNTAMPIVPTYTIPVETIVVTTAPTTEPTTEPTTVPTIVPETTEAVDADIGKKAAQVAVEQIGKPYEYGKAGPDAFDTSGLVQYCYKQCDVSIPRSNSALSEYGYIVDKDKILPGDAVFFWSSTPGKAEYLGIYVGGGKVVAAFNSSKPITQFDMNSNYYTEHFVFARRFY